MQITLDLPDSLADHFVAIGQDPSRAILELLAAESYRTKRLSEHQVRILLGFEPEWKYTHSWLKKAYRFTTPWTTCNTTSALRICSTPFEPIKQIAQNDLRGG